MAALQSFDLYQVDAFAERAFSGNPAAVVPLEHWLSDTLLLQIAEENNLAETAYLIADSQPGHYRLRWFTPATEVDLCGHATLAAAHTLWQHCGETAEKLIFHTRSGELLVEKAGADELRMNFPANLGAPAEPPAEMLAALGISLLVEARQAGYWLLVVDNEAQLAELQPDFSRLASASDKAVIVTAPSTEFDFVSRFFAPTFGINEDPVTGSAHCQLAPYWAQRLGKKRLSAFQMSARGGKVGCEMDGERVYLQGKAVTYLQGKIFVAEA